MELSRIAEDNLFEIIQDVLYFLVIDNPEASFDGSHLYFTTDSDFVYTPICEENGPYHLGHIYKYCKLLDSKLRFARGRNIRVIHYLFVGEGCDDEWDYQIANAIFLITAYSVFCSKKTAEEALQPFQKILHALPAYTDVCQDTPYELCILDCLRGLEKATKLKLVDYNSFNIREYEYYSNIKNGDMNWIVPGKILAMRGPRDVKKTSYASVTPTACIPLLKKYGVSAVVRLNGIHYDKRAFTDNGIKHYDLHFRDCGTPPLPLLKEFLHIVRKESGAVAVHCRAGLGRTGTMIGCALILNYKFTATETIAWLRICRPGSVMSIQQFFLEDMAATARCAKFLNRNKAVI